MMILRRSILLMAMSCSIQAFAQEAPTSYEPTPRYTSKSIVKAPVDQKREVTKRTQKKAKKGSFDWTLDQQVIEQQKRMKANIRKYKREEKLASKPQYSDPSYFGHKRKPKKRKRGKRKLCKECRIVH